MGEIKFYDTIKLGRVHHVTIPIKVIQLKELNVGDKVEVIIKKV